MRCDIRQWDPSAFFEYDTIFSCGSVTLDQVGLAFRPARTKAIVVISEVLTRLPLWAMFQYALTILGTLKPAR